MCLYCTATSRSSLNDGRRKLPCHCPSLNANLTFEWQTLFLSHGSHKEHKLRHKQFTLTNLTAHQPLFQSQHLQTVFVLSNNSVITEKLQGFYFIKHKIKINTRRLILSFMTGIYFLFSSRKYFCFVGQSTNSQYSQFVRSNVFWEACAWSPPSHD